MSKASPLLLSLLLLAASQSEAAVTINIRESGGNVVAQATGSLNVATLGTPADANVVGLIEFVGAGNYAYLLGPTQASVYIPGFTIQQPLNTTAVSSVADSSSGGPIGVDAVGQSVRLYVPRGYVSGSPINATSTWNGDSLASLGLTPGSYVFSYGTDSITYVVAGAATATAVPSFSALAALLLAFGLILIARRRLQLG